MQTKYAGRGLVVAGITKDTPERAAWFRDYLDADYPLLTQADEAFAAYGVVWVPVLYLVAPDGRIVAAELEAIEARLALELGG